MNGSLVLGLLSGKDGERVLLEVDELKGRHLDCSSEELLEKLIRRAAWRCALAAATASATGGPGGGLSAAADFSYQTRAFHRLALGIAALERRSLTPLESAAAAAASLALAVGAEWLRGGAVRAARRLFAERSPIVSALVAAAAGAAVGYGAAATAGALVRETLSRRSRSGRFFGKKRGAFG